MTRPVQRLKKGGACTVYYLVSFNSEYVDVRPLSVLHNVRDSVEPRYFGWLILYG